MRQQTEQYTLLAQANDAISTYPEIVLFDYFTAQKPYNLVAAHMAVTLEAGGSNVTGAFLAVGHTSDRLSVSNSTRLVFSLMTARTSISKDIWGSFGDYVIPVKSGDRVSLYLCGFGSVGRLTRAVVALHMVPRE